MTAAIVPSAAKYSTALRAIVALVVLLVVVVLVAALWIRHDRAAALASAFRADSAQAAADSSRRLLLQRGDSIRILGDSLGAVTRRAVQEEALSRDALDRATAATSALRSSMALRIRSLEATVASRAPVAESAGVRTASFAVDSAPFHAQAAVRLPPPPAAGAIALSVALDPATIATRVSCGAPVAGVRPASVIYVAPSWLTVRAGPTEATRDVCNAAAVRGAAKSGVPPWLAVLGVVGGVAGGVWIDRHVGSVKH